MRIIIGNLPDDATEDSLREALAGIAPVEAIRIYSESGTPTAVIETEMSKAKADAIAGRIQGRIYQGRELRAWVPVMPWK